MKYVGTKLILILLFSLSLIFIDYLYSNFLNMETKSYIRSNYQELCLECDFYPFFQEIGSEKFRIILLGENHLYKDNYDIFTKLIDSFSQTQKILYLAETSYANAELLNQYFRNRDDSFLRKSIMRYTQGSLAYTQDQYFFWTRLSSFQNIKIVGIDIEHQPVQAYLYLDILLQNRTLPSEIRDNLNKIRQFLVPFHGDVDAFMKNIETYTLQLQDDVSKRETLYRQAFGQDYYKFNLVLKNVANRFSIYPYFTSDFPRFVREREKRLVENFEYLYKFDADFKNPDVLVLGRFGSQHVSLRRLLPEYGDTFAQSVQSMKEWNGKVLSMLTIYGDPSSQENEIYRRRILRYFSDYTREIAVFRLDGPSSPFARRQLLLRKDSGGVTTDYFQYAVYIEHPTKTTPYTEP